MHVRLQAVEHSWPPGLPGLPGRMPGHPGFRPWAGRDSKPWGSYDFAGAGSASQTVIVLDTPLLCFPRRQAGGNWGGRGYPEIRSFYELPDLAKGGTQPTGTDHRQSPLREPLVSLVRAKLFLAQAEDMDSLRGGSGRDVWHRGPVQQNSGKEEKEASVHPVTISPTFQQTRAPKNKSGHRFGGM